MVERPYVHIIGRSKATAVDQLAYVQYRTEALRQLQESILFLGRRYKVIARYNSGMLLPGPYAMHAYAQKSNVILNE